MKNVIVIRQTNSIIRLPDFILSQNIKTEIILDGIVPTNNVNLFKLLRTKPINFLILIDAESANKFPELITKQYTCVMLQHEGNLTADISLYNQFNETLCINCGAWFWYDDKEYKDPNNRKLLNAINISHHLLSEKDYKSLPKPFIIDKYLSSKITHEFKKQLEI